uniref:Lon protease homolog n=1 Tax=Lates calcarifer TaxID=8187 RepID=A0A4W6DGL0_LATCA
MTSGGGIQIPSRLPLLLTHEGVLLPGSTVRFSIDSPRNMHLVSQRLLRGTSLKSTIIGVIPNTRDPEHDTDDLPTLHKIGTAGIAVQVVGSNWPKPHYTLLITGLCRFSVSSLLKERPFVLAEVNKSNPTVSPHVCVLVAKFRRLLDSLPRETLPDVVASMIRTIKQGETTVSLEERFKKALPMLTRQIEGLKLLQKTRKMGPDNDKRVLSVRKGGVFPGRQFNLDEEDEDDDGDDTGSLEKKVHGANMPEAALRVCLKELKRLKKMPQSMPEYALTRNYLDLMVELPWSKSTKDVCWSTWLQCVNMSHIYLLLFGKTSVGRSIARTLGREFHRIALGGVCDQSDIRGHRRTYVGSMPGRIINGLKTVGVNNPVFLLDEVDKLGKSLQGDPAAALLEVLDPEQNHSFTDHYLNVAFDLSQVLFIATANTTATIPPALLDRMEVLQVPGYTQEEKVEIAHRHLIPNQLEQHGLTPQQLHIPQDTTQDIISRYTREAGVRSLERKIGAICRAVAVKVAEGHRLTKTEARSGAGLMGCISYKAAPPEMPIVIDHIALKDILGPPLFEMEVSERFTLPGVALGLVWTPLGGEIMFVEASRMEGEGQLTLTGQLGDVMKESAHLAISWLRANAKTYQLTSMVGGPDPLEGTDIHLHFPAGAVTKDGPSAGVTIVTCLASLFSGRLVRSDVAMTGEITLRGLVLPVGGIKDKVLAAYRAGVKRVILPKRNEKDLEELPANVRADLDFVTAGNLDEVLNAAFDGGFPGTASTRTHHQLTSKL